MKKVAKNIRLRRREMGISQHELAVDLGVSKLTVSNYERNITNPCPVTMAKLSRALNVPVSYFFLNL